MLHAKGRIALLGVALSGCAREEGSIVVYATVDTLGLAAARETGWCERLRALTGEYGLDMACVDGGVAPSTWTGESHTRMLWPQHRHGDLQALHYPACGESSVLELLNDDQGGLYMWAADNIVLSDSGKETCSPFRTQFTQGAERKWVTSLEAWDLGASSDPRPVDDAIDVFAGKVGRKPAIQFFWNALEPGGHVPRCWQHPYDGACDELWAHAVTNGLVDELDPRAETWLQKDFTVSLNHLMSVANPAEDLWRPLGWDTTLDAIDANFTTWFDDRLRRILDAAAEAGRIDDVQLVILGDHGENPCLEIGLGDPNLNCGHNGLATEYTAFVPVFVAPSKLADLWTGHELIGDDDRPWSTTNLAYGLVDAAGMRAPLEWGPPEPPGVATTITCQSPDGQGGSGAHIEGQEAVRCRDGQCEAITFAVPDGGFSVPEVLDEVSDALEPYLDAQWVRDACGR